MAQMDDSADSGHKKGPGVKKAKKQSTRIDMTPMVDLGFLLITFFIFTTTLSTPNTMKLTMPKDDVKEKDLTEVKESNVLTIMMGKANQVYYYEGQLAADGSNFKSSNFKDIRDEIIRKKKEVVGRGSKLEDYVVVIKPNDEATYANSIDMLDEMTIDDVKTYAMVKITPSENDLIKQTEEANGVR